jgi:membrane protein CcdC involved in cytochrome C biogenesis
MKQSRLMSLVESLVNVLVGYGVAVAAQMLVFPLFGLAVTVSENLLIGLIFTVVSIVRSYALRRGFEVLRVRQSAMASSTISQ